MPENPERRGSSCRFGSVARAAAAVAVMVAVGVTVLCALRLTASRTAATSAGTADRDGGGAGGGAGDDRGQSRVLPPASSRSLNAAAVVVPAGDPYVAARHAVDSGTSGERRRAPPPVPSPQQVADSGSTGTDRPRHAHHRGTGGTATIDGHNGSIAAAAAAAADTRRNVTHRQMDYRDHWNVPETDDGWKPIVDSSATHRQSQHIGPAYGYDDARPDDDGSTAVGHYSTIKQSLPGRYWPTQSGGSPTVADLQPTGTDHGHQSWTPSRPPSDASYRPPPPPPPHGSRLPPPSASWPYPTTVAQKKTAAAAEPAAAPAAGWVDWRLIGTIALVKLGLVKLKAFALVGALLLLLFKLKAFVAKFALLLKLAKFFKVLLAPLFLVPLVALVAPMALAALFAAPERTLQALLAPNNASAALPGLPGGASPAGPQSTNPTSPGGQQLLPGVPATGQSAVASVVRRTTRGAPVLLTPPTVTGSRDSDPLRRGRPDDYPTALVLWTLLDSEKCVERIACRMAAAERSGAIPSWINWVLRNLSKCLPNEKLESYFKTFDGINNGDLIDSSAIDNNWETWCFEHFDCNRINVTHVTDTTNNSSSAAYLCNGAGAGCNTMQFFLFDPTNYTTIAHRSLFTC